MDQREVKETLGDIEMAEEEIRTLGWFPVGGFQDRCLQPLGHPSAMEAI